MDILDRIKSAERQVDRAAFDLCRITADRLGSPLERYPVPGLIKRLQALQCELFELAAAIEDTRLMTEKPDLCQQIENVLRIEGMES